VGKLEDLTAEIFELEQQLSAKCEERHALYISELPWKIGDIVRMTRSCYGCAAGSLWKIVGFYDPSAGWARAVSQKKDGSWGVRKKILFGNFEVVDSGI
jgi:hypothetical protein